MSEANIAGSSRVVHCADALAWLSEQPVIAGASFIASMPDYSEFPRLTLGEWKQWFVSTAELILSRTPDDGVAIFFQSDIKHEGTWVDKGFLVQQAAERTGHALLWHKIVCRVRPGQATYGRPAYSHLLCFSRGVRDEVARSTGDVLPDPGEYLWARGMASEAAALACRYILKHTSTRTVINPFCGHGTVLAVANRLGLAAVGIEMSRKRAEKAQLAGVRPTATDVSDDAEESGD